MVASDSSSGNGGHASGLLPQHPLVERLKPDPAHPPVKTTVLVGLPGNSDRPGFQRLYLTTALDYFAEFPVQSILHSEAVPAEESPFKGLEATRVTITRDSLIHYTWVRSSQPVDEFDLDLRLGGIGPGAAPTIPTRTCPDGTFCGTCNGTCDQTCGPHCPTHRTCQTQCNQPTCTCQTQCNQPTCAGTCTCQTQCNQLTCATCPTDCNQRTCNTCRTDCNQRTCDNCTDTCHRPCQ
jgi:hypothetical protein